MNHALIVAGSSVAFVVALLVIAFQAGKVVGKYEAFRVRRVEDVRDGRL
jgi:hypothetical protein